MTLYHRYYHPNLCFQNYRGR